MPNHMNVVSLHKLANCRFVLIKVITQILSIIGVFFVLAAMTACDYKSHKPVHVLADFKTQPLDQTRILLQPVKASIYPIEQWRVRAIAYYSPLDSDQPNATETTSSRKNCINQRYSLNIHLTPCTRTFDRRVERDLSSDQISASSQALYLDYFYQVQDQQADFRVDNLSVTIKECPDCQEHSYTLDMSCWAEDVTTENIQSSSSYGAAFVVRYLPSQAQSKVGATCGLKKEEFVGSYTKDSVMNVLRGHFHEGDYVSDYQLLDTFPAIPTKNGSWIANEANVGDQFSDFCHPASGQPYDRTDFNVKMDKTQGWPFLPDVEVLVYKGSKGNVCGIWLDGYGEFETYTQRVRYFFSFYEGKLALLKTEEPNSLEHSWRYFKGEPFEYIESQDDSVAGDQEIRYWHKDAAREWPEKMDYTPDFNEFRKQQEFAAYLVSTYGSQQASGQ